MRIAGPCVSRRIADRPRNFRRDLPDARDDLAHPLVLGVAHVEPENIRARSRINRRSVSGFSVAGPSVQMILVLRIRIQD